MTFDELVASARARAQELLRQQIAELPAVRTTEEALRVLQAIELDMVVIGHELKALTDAHLIKREDVQAFDRLRNNLNLAQRRLLVFVREVFVGHSEILRRLPSTAPLAPPAGSPLYVEDPATHSTATNALGPWAIAGIIVAALIALGLMVYMGSRIYDSFDGLVDLYVMQEQTRQMRELYEARLAALQQCIREQEQQHHPTEFCYGAATQLVPTPQSALVPLPPRDKSYALWWFIGGMAVVAGLVGLGAYLAYRKPDHEPKKSTKGVRGYHEVDPADFDDDHDSNYQLEVGR